MSLSVKPLATTADNLGTVAINPSALDGLANDVSGAEKLLTSNGNSPYPDQGGWLMNTDEAAKYLGLSPHTLSKWRITGKGPPFQLLGRRCLYSPETLRQWASTKIRASTSDMGLGTA
jgi:hypothetical protein